MDILSIVQSAVKKFKAYVYLIILIPMLSACILLPEEQKILNPPLKQPEKVSYTVVEIKKTSLERKITGSGVLETINQKDLSYKYRGGNLKAIYVKAGDKVDMGQLLAELETGELEGQIRRQRNELYKAQIYYDQIKHNGMLDIQAAKLQLSKLTKKRDELKSIEGGAAKADMDDLELQIEQQKINLKKLTDTYGTGIDGKEGYSLRLAAISIRDAEGRLEELQKEFDESKLVSPISGIVTYVSKIREGQYVNIHQNIIQISDPSELIVKYTGDKASAYKAGMEADIEIKGSAYKGRVVMSPVDAPEDAEDELKKTVLIEVDSLNNSDAFKSMAEIIGTQAAVTITPERKDNIIVLPNGLVKYYGRQAYVYVLEDGIRVERYVETGMQTETEVEITKGLAEGENIIVR